MSMQSAKPAAGEAVPTVEETSKPRPVPLWENEELHGLALCDEGLFEEKIDKITKARARQAAYKASLPCSGDEAILAARRALHPRGKSYPDGFEEALDIVFLVQAVVQNPGNLEDNTISAVLNRVLERAYDGLMNVQRRLDHVSDVLGAPAARQRES